MKLSAVSYQLLARDGKEIADGFLLFILTLNLHCPLWAAEYNITDKDREGKGKDGASRRTHEDGELYEARANE